MKRPGRQPLPPDPAEVRLAIAFMRGKVARGEILKHPNYRYKSDNVSLWAGQLFARAVRLGWRLMRPAKKSGNP